MMKSTGRIAVFTTALILGTAPAVADSYWEVEAARANARAGGPTNPRDAELLERYGCLSGTNSAFCRKLSGEQRRVYRVEKRRQRDKN